MSNKGNRKGRGWQRRRRETGWEPKRPKKAASFTKHSFD